MREVCRTIAPLLRPGTLVMDVGSVKMKPARILVEELPEHVELAATHPMFGPQSIRSGVPLKIVICPLRGRRIWRAGAFLRHQLGMSVIISTPEDHDREAAYTQGLFHFIAGGMLRLDHAPKRITTPSFDLLRKAVDMVRHDAAAVSSAIELENPFAEAARAEFVWHLEAVRLRKDSATAHE
jgi:prephenate dehydrogenase